jgi:hypothetical protein
MKLLPIIILLWLPCIKVFCQDENVIKLKSEVTLTLSQAENGVLSYKFSEIKKFNQAINIANNDLLKNNVDSNKVKLFFCTGEFGGDEKTVLIIKSGLKTMLQYSAKIKTGDRDYFETTSVEPLFPNVKSIEEWPYKISEIVLSDFTTMRN